MRIRLRLKQMLSGDWVDLESAINIFRGKWFFLLQDVVCWQNMLVENKFLLYKIYFLFNIL